MLNNHMQSIVAYFSKSAGLEPQSKAIQPQAPRSSHLQPAIDYLVRKPAPQLDEPRNSTQPSESKSNLLIWLQQFWQNLLTADLEPQIREGMTSSGEAYWRVYDPLAQTSHTFFDEEEVYRWLEQRYYE